MQKLKNRKSVTKRYRKTKNNKYMYKHPYKAHILEKKSQKQKRHMRKLGLVAKGDAKMLNLLLPY